MDFPYLEKVTKLNVAALAAIASAPPPPEPKVEGAVSTDTKLTWWGVDWRPPFQYVVRWRRTDANNWTEESRAVECQALAIGVREADGSLRGQAPSCEITLKGVRVDDWVFGVSSISKDGFESPVASAVPGGAFKPYVAPPPAEKK
jgi:hypothetical protein